MHVMEDSEYHNIRFQNKYTNLLQCIGMTHIFLCSVDHQITEPVTTNFREMVQEFF